MPGSPKKAARRARWEQYCQTRSPACMRLEIEASGLSMLDWAKLNDFAYTKVRDYTRQDQTVLRSHQASMEASETCTPRPCRVTTK